MNLQEAVSILRIRLGDENKTKFTDDTFLELELKDAMHKHNREYTLETVPEDEEYLIVKLAQISCLYTLASREAKNYSISVDGISIAKSERVKNYLSLANSLEKEYDSIINDPDYQTIEVHNMKRYSPMVNRLVGGD
jgi:hypothetical protein